MEKDSKQIFRELQDGLRAYADLKLELLRLRACEQVGKVAGALFYGLILVLLAFFVLLFLFLSGGFFLSECFRSQGLGFGSIVLVYLFIGGAVVANKKRISLRITNEVIAALRAGDEKDKEP